MSALALLVCGVGGERASAQEPAGEAATLLRRGLDARRAGRDAEALSLFEQAQHIAPRVSVEAQIGFALQALGRWSEADAQLTRVAASDDAWVQRHRETVEEALAVVRSHLASIEVRGEPAGAEVLLDGRPAGRLPLSSALRVVAGSVTLTVRADGYYPIEHVLTLRAGDVSRESVDLARRAVEPSAAPSAVASAAPTAVPAASAAPSAAPDAGASSEPPGSMPPERRPNVFGPVVVLGVGAAAFFAGLGTFVHRNALLDRVRTDGCTETPTAFECPSNAPMLNDARLAHEDATTMGTASTALFISSGVLVGAGLVWLVVEQTLPRRASSARGLVVPARGALFGVHF